MASNPFSLSGNNIYPQTDRHRAIAQPANSFDKLPNRSTGSVLGGPEAHFALAANGGTRALSESAEPFPDELMRRILFHVQVEAPFVDVSTAIPWQCGLGRTRVVFL